MFKMFYKKNKIITYKSYNIYANIRKIILCLQVITAIFFFIRKHGNFSKKTRNS